MGDDLDSNLLEITGRDSDNPEDIGAGY